MLMYCIVCTQTLILFFYTSIFELKKPPNMECLKLIFPPLSNCTQHFHLLFLSSISLSLFLFTTCFKDYDMIFRRQCFEGQRCNYDKILIKHEITLYLKKKKERFYDRLNTSLIKLPYMSKNISSY